MAVLLLVVVRRKPGEARNMWLACHTQEEIAAAVDLSPTDKSLRLSGDLETFPKNQKLLATFQDADFRQPLYNVWRYGECAALSEQHLAQQALKRNVVPFSGLTFPTLSEQHLAQQALKPLTKIPHDPPCPTFRATPGTTSS